MNPPGKAERIRGWSRCMRTNQSRRRLHRLPARRSANVPAPSHARSRRKREGRPSCTPRDDPGVLDHEWVTTLATCATSPLGKLRFPCPVKELIRIARLGRGARVKMRTWPPSCAPFPLLVREHGEQRPPSTKKRSSSLTFNSTCASCSASALQFLLPLAAR